MQQQELAQMRQRDANLTALAAIGPRKKRKVDSPGSGSGTEVRCNCNLWFCCVSLCKNLSVQSFFPSLWKLSEQQKCILCLDLLTPRPGSIFSICVVAQGIKLELSFPDMWNWRNVRKAITVLSSLCFFGPP